MINKLALKRLTASDLTFFEWHFKHHNAGNQKAFNLNADVFKDQLYPSLDIIARDRQNKIGVDLWVAGPAAAKPINLQRKIIKGKTYKNWRLDGEFIYNPEEEPDRFNVLLPGDIVLFGFEGELAPDAVTLVLVAKTAEEDKLLFNELDSILGTHRMISLEADALRELCQRPPVSNTHPIWSLVADEDFVEAGSGMAQAMNRLLKRPRFRGLSREALRKARQVAEEIGRFGEELVDFHLKCRLDVGEITIYEWVSDSNAISPFDFRIQCGGVWEKLEIKTTSGKFGRAYHLPFSELQDMACGGETYRVARVYEVTPSGAKMRISNDLQDLAQAILKACSAFPPGIALDGVTITPDEAIFGSEIVLSIPDDDEN